MQVQFRYINKYMLLTFGAFLFLSYRYLVQNASLMISYGGLAVCSILAIFFLILNRTVNISDIYPILFFDVVAIIAIIYNHNGNLSEIIVLFSFQIIGMLLFFRNETYSIVWLFSIGYYLYLFINRVRGIDPDTIFYLTSRNYVSVFSLLFLTLYIFNKVKCGGKIRIWFFLLHIYMCVWAHGRGGILTAAIALVGFIIFGTDFLKLPRVLKISFLLICVVGIILLYYDLITAKISAAMVVEGRLGIWSRYLTSATDNIIDFVLGVKNYSLTIDILRMHHLHNSFLNLHYYFGIVPLVMFAVIGIKMIYFFSKRKKYTLIVICMTLVVRMFTDVMAFPGEFDILWIYIFLLYRKYKNNSTLNGEVVK